MMRVIKIGILSVEEQRKRALEIASGKRKRDNNDPIIYMPSMAAAARILSDENMALLKIIREQHPSSVDELANLVGKPQSNVSRSLHAMEPFGLVELRKSGRQVTPVVTFEHLDMALI
ncbi:HVO_A0114 family putative DNA-binding protein [Noviherbaspirillum malthae]|jgi:predicted transcriptional regulator|uniref:HVO_A0114 family putative DNA-binding protein n=1 Tax=Noviherbaspirillum malthae TaxID=1260987 RepID=UPI00188FE61A|nr:ArsR family transcriptional regulator [Noviherbaspirillum malthae]